MDNFINIKVPFTVPTKDLKNSERIVLNVKTNIPISGNINSDPIYKVTIPDFIFNELADTEPQFKTTYDVNNKIPIKGLFDDKEITYKFKKTQTSKLISILQEYFSDLTKIINNRHCIETETLTKKIFIKFDYNINHTTNGLNNAYMGEHISQQFQYFIGYEVYTDKFSLNLKKEITKKYITKILYAPPGSSLQKLDTKFTEKDDLFILLPRFNQSIDSFEKEFSIIDWTKEREDFCEKIKKSFINVNEELSKFLKNIDSNKIDMLMKSNLKFLE